MTFVYLLVLLLTTGSHSEELLNSNGDAKNIEQTKLSESKFQLLRDGEENPETKLVETENGFVEGYLLKNSNIYGFYDIPYGQFKEYFQPPLPAEKWTQRHQIEEHKSICPQMDQEEIIGDTNCLTLSIFAPNEANHSSVLFHIHDSDFVRGSGDPSIYKPDNLVSQDVVLVLPNYRLGALGFLCLQNDTAPGNAGLKDLTLALKWVAENIIFFGGDPGNIVMSGEGSAGALVGYLALSPQSNVYISKAITESESVLSPNVLDRDPLNTVSNFLRNLPESIKLSSSNLTVEAILMHSKDIEFRPCIELSDNGFLKKTPWNLLSNNESDKTFIIGTASNGGVADIKNLEIINEFNKHINKIIPNDLSFNDEEAKKEVAHLIKDQYFSSGIITLEDVNSLILYYTDIMYLVPSIRFARSLVQAGAKVFFYELSYTDGNKIALDTVLEGAMKGDTAKYLFGLNDALDSESEEHKIKTTIADLWVSFIKGGFPAAENVKWKELKKTTEEEEQWLSIDSNTTMKTGVHINRLSLWSHLYEEHYIDNKAYKHKTTFLIVLSTFTVFFRGNV